MKKYIENANICLTGGTDGIGLCLARELSTKGANLLVIGRRPRTETQLPDNIAYHAIDLSTDTCTAEIAQKISNMGWRHLDFLIHNAGLGYVGALDQQTDQSIKDILNVNLTAPLIITNALFPLLQKKHGTLCLIGSTAKGRSTPDFAVYTASKTALSDMARNLRTEWREKIDVQEINPGPTKTSFHAKSGLKNPPMAFLFMKPQEVAQEIGHLLETGKKEKNFTVFSLLYFAMKRFLKKGQK